MPDATDKTQALSSQNIFELLGVADGTPEQREDFLTRLQQAVWDDFINNDLELLLNEKEMESVKEILNNQDYDNTTRQQKILVYLTDLVPDLDQIMYEKALKLKRDLVMERIASLEQLAGDRSDKMAELAEMRRLIDEDRWRDVGEQLNNFRV